MATQHFRILFAISSVS